MLSDEILYHTENTQRNTHMSQAPTVTRGTQATALRTAAKFIKRGPGANWRVPAVLTKGNYKDRQNDRQAL